MPLPDASILPQLLSYDAETSALFWRERPVGLFPDLRSCAAWNARYAGRQVAINWDRHGYGRVRVLDRTVLLHRLIWALFRGEWPRGEIDHMNGDPSDNKISNLRLATRSQNTQNCATPKTNKTGWKGVSNDARSGAWVARIKSNGEKTHIGVFKCPTAAGIAYLRMGQKLHGQFFRNPLAALEVSDE